jgi:DNA-binding NarL/FixJ family response regulator
MIRVVVVDDHPALRAGLKTVLRSEPGLVFVGESNGVEETLWPALQTTRPDLVLLDYHLPHGDGLQLCYRLKHEVPTPKVIIFTAYASPTLSLPATLAQADGLLAKGVGARDLFTAIRQVHNGDRLLPPISRSALEDAHEKLRPDDLALMGMLLDGASEPEIARTLRRDPHDVRNAVRRMLSALRIDVPAAQAM